MKLLAMVAFYRLIKS